MFGELRGEFVGERKVFRKVHVRSVFFSRSYEVSEKVFGKPVLRASCVEGVATRVTISPTGGSEKLSKVFTTVSKSNPLT